MTHTAVMVRIEVASVQAGDVIAGSIDAASVVAVELVRIEQSGASTIEFPVAAGTVGLRGSFALTVPEGAPPTTNGRTCRLGWRVRAACGDPSDPRYEATEIVLLP